MLGIIIAGAGIYLGYQAGNKTNSIEQITKNMEAIAFTDFPYKNFVDSVSFSQVRDTYAMYIQRAGPENGRQMLASLGNRICYKKVQKDWYLDTFEIDDHNVSYKKFIRCMMENEAD